MSKDEWDVRIETHATVTASAQHYLLHSTVRTFKGEDLFFERTFEKKIVRTSA
jgi:hypothetical protein